MSASQDIRADFTLAARCFVELVADVPTSALTRPGLGEWTVRDLMGHTSRSLVTVEAYLTAGATGPATIADPVEYYRAAAPLMAEPEAIVERGRQAGAALGDDPASFVRELADRALALVDGASDDAMVASIVGPMRLIDYLPTRTFELVVHTLDLTRALQVDVPRELDGPAGRCGILAVRLAADRGDAAPVLMALTGRTELPAGFGVL